MELKERLESCKICVNKEFNSTKGIVCSLTDKKPSFNLNCADFEKDEVIIKKNESQQIKKELNHSFPKGAVMATIVGLVFLIIKFLLKQ